MTITNIVAGIKTTGVYLLNRLAVVGKGVTVCESLAEKTGLSFIPLYSPSHSRKPARKSVEFDPEEIVLFQIRYKEGYNLPDERYERWLKMYHPTITPQSSQATTLLFPPVTS